MSALSDPPNIVWTSHPPKPVYEPLNVTCIGCGAVWQVEHGDELYEKAAARTQLDALPVRSADCNDCQDRFWQFEQEREEYDLLDRIFEDMYWSD